MRVKNRGFTLIELLLVIGVVIILSSVVISLIKPSQQEAISKDAVLKTKLQELASAMETFKTVEGIYPPDNNMDGKITPEDSDVVATYFDSWPEDTPNGAEYIYQAGPAGFSIRSPKFTQGCFEYCSTTSEIIDVEDCSVASECGALALVISPPGPPSSIEPTCGDGTCNGSETCNICSVDCGSCSPPTPPSPPPPTCGDGTCSGSETCSSCSADCGTCPAPPSCGDGLCKGTETCSSCSIDCGACPIPPPTPYCGDGTCNGSETCSTCSADCGTCNAYTFPGFKACPGGTKQIAYIDDWVANNAKALQSKTYTVNLSKNSKITIVGYGVEGHPEDCPNGPTCLVCPNGGKCGDAPQSNESFKLYTNNTILGTYIDSGVKPADDGYYDIKNAPWISSTTYNAGAVDIKIEHIDIGKEPISSVGYKLTVCESK